MIDVTKMETSAPAAYIPGGPAVIDEALHSHTICLCIYQTGLAQKHFNFIKGASLITSLLRANPFLGWQKLFCWLDLQMKWGFRQTFGRQKAM